jgi:hypothetical protein
MDRAYSLGILLLDAILLPLGTRIVNITTITTKQCVLFSEICVTMKQKDV